MVSHPQALRLDGSDKDQHNSAMAKKVILPLPESPMRDFCLQPGYLESDFHTHDHSFHELVVLLEGQAEHIVSGNIYPVRAGDIYVFHPGVEHGFQNVRKLRLVNLSWKGDWLERHRESLGTLPGFHALFTIEPGLRRLHRFAARLQIDPKALSSVILRLDALEREYRARRPGFAAAVESEFLSLAVLLCRAYDGNFSREAKAVLRLGLAVAFLETHYREKVRMSAVAKLSGLSERQFLRLFSQAYGLAPAAYLMQLRLRAAQALLRQGIGVTEAALESGFFDSNYFARAFRKSLGMSPSAWVRSVGG